MNNFAESYRQILKTLQEIEPKMNFLNQIRIPKLSDIELISLALTAEYLSIDSEHQLFRSLPIGLSNRIERSVYNRRKRRLFDYIEALRSRMAEVLVVFEDYFIVDSMPIEICKLSRERRVKICREAYETAPERGFCASQNRYFFGYKLHAVCTVSGVFKSIELAKASCTVLEYKRALQ